MHSTFIAIHVASNAPTLFIPIHTPNRTSQFVPIGILHRDDYNVYLYLPSPTHALTQIHFSWMENVERRRYKIVLS